MQAFQCCSRVCFRLLAILTLLCVSSPLYAQTYIEDFEDDPAGLVGGFDPLFNHLFTGPNEFISDDVAFPALDQPSLHHELFFGTGVAALARRPTRSRSTCPWGKASTTPACG